MSKRYSIDECRNIIAKKGFECLSETYINSHTPLILRCKEKHIWKANLNSINSGGTGCPYCCRHIKRCIEDCREIAENNNGECLSNIYVSNKKKLTWRCKNNHVWEASFNKINSGQWCPHCKKDKIIQTCINKYGASNPMKSPEIAKRSARAIAKSIKRHWLTGEELICQSSWEAKVVDYLNINNVNYQWQPKIFILPNGKTYRPDLFLIDSNTWVEIKGYFRDKSIKKWNMFLTMVDNAELWTKDVLKNMGILIH